MIMSLKYYLAEANVFNVADIKAQLSSISSQISEPYQKSFVKAAFTELTNNEMHHEKIASLPPGSPDWAQAALNRGDLVRVQITEPIRDELERLVHWIKDLESKSSSLPTPEDSDGLEDRAEARKLLAALPRMSFRTMISQEETWWKRARAVDPANLSGMHKMIDVGGGWAWWRLDSDDAYKREGQVLKNCIGKIWTKSNTDSQGQHILVLKDPRGQSHVAMRVHGLEVLEIKGMNNRPPSPAYMGRTNDALKKLRYTVGSGGQSDLGKAGYVWDKDRGVVYHMSEKFPFEMGPTVGTRLMLVKWTAPFEYWSPSFGGRSKAGHFGKDPSNSRYDLVSSRNTYHPALSMVVGNGAIIALGNLPNPDNVIKETGMKNLASQINASARALGVRLSEDLNGRDGESVWQFDPGIRRYGLTVVDGSIKQDIELASEMSVRANPKSIASIDDPPERLQVAAATSDPNVVLLIANPAPAAQVMAVQQSQNTHTLFNRLIDKLGRQPDDAVVQAAVQRDWHCIEKIRHPSEAAEMQAIKQSLGFAMSYVAYWRAETGRDAPPIQMQMLAAKQEGGVDAIKSLLEFGRRKGWTIDPAVQMEVAKSSEMDEIDLQELKQALESHGQLDPRVARVINQRIANAQER